MCRYITLFLVFFRSVLGNNWEEVYQASNQWKVEGELLYWQAIQEQMYYALSFKEVQPATGRGVVSPEIAPSVVMKRQGTKFSPGFRIGAFYEINCFCNREWAIGAKWTRFQQSTYSHIASNDYLVGAVLLANVVDQMQYAPNGVNSYAASGQSASSKWSLEVNSVDFITLYRTSRRKRLEFYPYCGVKGVAIRQQQEATYAVFQNILGSGGVDAQSTFKGGGPLLGMKALSSLFLCNTEFFVDLTASCIYAHSIDKSALTMVVLNSGVLPLPMNPPFSSETINKLWVLKPLFECAFGVQYRSPCLYQCASVFFKLAGELQLWTGQWNRFINIAHAMNVPVPLEGSLMLQGITASCGIQF